MGDTALGCTQETCMQYKHAYTMGKWAKSEWHFQGPIAWLWR